MKFDFSEVLSMCVNRSAVDV